jgi:hypothetical protein
VAASESAAAATTTSESAAATMTATTTTTATATATMTAATAMFGQGVRHPCCTKSDGNEEDHDLACDGPLLDAGR